MVCTCDRCVCAPGYVGDDCSVDYDDCQEHKCQNNAECVDEINGYSCACTRGYRSVPVCFLYDMNPLHEHKYCVCLSGCWKSFL